MLKSECVFQTEKASRYLQQLCKHWSHKLPVVFDPEKGTVDFGEAQSILLATDEGLQIMLSTKTDNKKTLEKYQTVLEKHLERFAFREECVFVWTEAV